MLTLNILPIEYEFALLCLRCSVLPGMSHWLNRLSSTCARHRGDQDAQAQVAALAGLGSFKQMCGLLCDIVTALFSADGPSNDQMTALFRQVTLLYVQCAVEPGSEPLVRIGNSCFRYIIAISICASLTATMIDSDRHLVLNCGHQFQSTSSTSDQLWHLTASALCLIIRCNLATVQRLIQEDRIAEGPVLEVHSSGQQRPFRLSHLSRQVFSLDAEDETTNLGRANSGPSILVALLSYQLAVNLAANIVCSSNTVLTG